MKTHRVDTTLIVILLVASLLTLGVYYAGQYLEDQEYIRYPLRYEKLIVKYAERYDLEPWHIAAVVLCESRFRESATSEVGARGLMQIMPETGKWLAEKFGDKYKDSILYDPDTNLKYGCWYLSWLMEHYEGDIRLVTTAYHAGNGTVDRWLANPEVSPDGKTIPVIPYESTRIYVERVLKAYEKYPKLYDFEAICAKYSTK